MKQVKIMILGLFSMILSLNSAYATEQYNCVCMYYKSTSLWTTKVGGDDKQAEVIVKILLSEADSTEVTNACKIAVTTGYFNCQVITDTKLNRKRP